MSTGSASRAAVLSGPQLPVRLFDLPEPPERLYVRGTLPRGPGVAIVGTRSATMQGERFACELARELAREGVIVLSGGALGIDGAAHRGALDGRGATVVVAPAGFAAPFPPEHEELFQRVVAHDGAYVAAVADDVPATRAAFFPRNGYLVALAHAVVVVQSDFRGGARNAAAQARALGRPVLAVPGAPWMPKTRGCVAELRLGAEPCEGARDVLRVLERLGLHLVAAPKIRRRRAPPPVLEGPDPTEADVLAAVRGGASHPDDLAVHLGCSTARVQRTLLTLELRGVLVRAPTGGVILSKQMNLF